MSECLSYVASRGRWVGTPDGCTFELVVDGSAGEVSSPALALAQGSLAHHQALQTQAIDYVRRFINTEAASLHGEAALVALFAGNSGDVVTLDLSFPGDVYGLWWVEFFHHANGVFEPSAFGRFAW